VTRSKELKRIEGALETTDPAELRWAATECRLRLRFVTKKRGGGRWRSLLGRIEAALRQAGVDASDNPFLPSAMVVRQRSEKQQPGKATGRLICTLKVPSLDVNREDRFSENRQMSRVRRFVQNWLPETEVAREGASLTVSAEVRHRGNQGVRRLVLCRWRAGQSITEALERAAQHWDELQKI
jgi:hypothetical protein